MPTTMTNIDWTCPFCNRHATITDQSVRGGITYLTIPNSEGARAIQTHFVVCPNPKCKKFTLAVSLHTTAKNANGDWEPHSPIRTWMLIPSSRAQSFPAYIPKAILEDYNEACLI